MPITDPVLGWDEKVWLGTEPAYGTAIDPLAANALEVVSLDMGPGEQGMTREKKDKSAGRGSTNAFVEGRVSPIPFSLETSVKSRATAAAAAKEQAILKAAGFIETIGATAAYALSSNPAPLGLSVYTVAGTGVAANFGEQGRGGAVKSLNFSGGDKELTLKASGAFAGKYALGAVPSITVTNVATTVVVTAEEGDRIGLGYYQCESEIFKVTANDNAGNLTIARAQLGGGAAVAHTAVPMYPYQPAQTLAGSPISEANCTVTLDGIATRCTKFNLDFTTGIDHLPGETGSAYAQGLKVVRYQPKVSLELVLTTQFAALFGKAKRRKAVALTIVCGTGAGGIFTFSLPYCELEPFSAPKSNSDIVIVSPSIRVRDNAGNDGITITGS